MGTNQITDRVKHVLFDRLLAPPQSDSARLRSHSADYGFAYRYDDLFGFSGEDLQAICRDCVPVNGPILDVGGGTGRLAEMLVKQGKRVVLLDNSESMLESARHRKEQLAAPSRRLFEIRRQDVRRFEPDGQYPVILSVFGPLPYLDNAAEVVGVLKNIQASLAEGGLFYFTVVNVRYWQINSPWKTGRWRYFRRRKAPAGTYHTWMRTCPERNEARVRWEYAVTKDFLFFTRCGVSVQFYTVKEWTGLFEKAGLEISAVRGIWDHPSDIDPNWEEKHPCLTLVARRKGSDGRM